MPERAIAHRQKRADRRLLDAPSEGGHHQYFKVAIRRPVHVCPDIPRVLGDTLEIVLILGLNQQPARSGPSGCSLRGCSSSRVEDGLAANVDLASETPILAFWTRDL